MFSVRNKPKKVHFYNNNNYYNSFVNININEHSHIIDYNKN